MKQSQHGPGTNRRDRPESSAHVAPRDSVPEADGRQTGTVQGWAFRTRISGQRAERRSPSMPWRVEDSVDRRQRPPQARLVPDHAGSLPAAETRDARQDDVLNRNRFERTGGGSGGRCLGALWSRTPRGDRGPGGRGRRREIETELRLDHCGMIPVVREVPATGPRGTRQRNTDREGDDPEEGLPERRARLRRAGHVDPEGIFAAYPAPAARCKRWRVFERIKGGG